MKKFLFKSSILTVVIFVIGLLLYQTILKPYFTVTLIFIPIFFFVFTNLMYLFLQKIASKSSAKFTSQYMAISFLKMFVYLLIVVVFIIANKSEAKIFAVNFLLMYVVYTIFEVSEFSKEIRQLGK